MTRRSSAASEDDGQAWSSERNVWHDTYWVVDLLETFGRSTAPPGRPRRARPRPEVRSAVLAAHAKVRAEVVPEPEPVEPRQLHLALVTRKRAGEVGRRSARERRWKRAAVGVRTNAGFAPARAAAPTVGRSVFERVARQIHTAYRKPHEHREGALQVIAARVLPLQ